MKAADRKKLAKAARELASDFAEGRGPDLDVFTWCNCAAGHVANHNEELSFALDMTVEGALTRATALETGKGMGVGWKHTPGAVVFPLLWLADELESAP